MALDHYSGELIGTHASHQATRWEALEPIRREVARHFGDLAQDNTRGSPTCLTGYSLLLEQYPIMLQRSPPL